MSVYTNITCVANRDCAPNGICDVGFCMCNACYLDDLDTAGVCMVELVPIIAGFLISFFVGGCGCDHCFMSGCTCPGVCLGIFKALTFGGLAVWWLVDWIFMANGTFNEMYDIEGYKILCGQWTN